ncbi:MAG: hypothetical protein ACYSR9_12230 [Planctomycetota bacterium]
MTSISLELLTQQDTYALDQAFYVAPDGDDVSGDGSLSKPWAGITHALDNVPDGVSITVLPGTYSRRVRLRGVFDQGVTVRSGTPYQARLRHNATVVTCYYGKGITLEGFDIAHSGPGSGALVIQIQDLIGEPGGDDYVSRITLNSLTISGPTRPAQWARKTPPAPTIFRTPLRVKPHPSPLATIYTGTVRSLFLRIAMNSSIIRMMPTVRLATLC